MSMRIRVYEDGGGGVVIRLEEDDPVAIGQLVIPPEHRTAVALALLGDRDALIERMAHTLSVEFWSITPDEWDLLLPADHENLRQRARRVLAAIDGGGKGWGYSQAASAPSSARAAAPCHRSRRGCADIISRA